MADIGESSTVPPKSTNKDKPVVVRVKRKAVQSCVEAIWIEINGRPAKRPLLDFDKLSISDSSSSSAIEELKTKKVLVRHVETVSSSEDTFDILQSCVPDYAFTFERKSKIEERRLAFKKETKQDKLLGKARQEQEALAKSARFEQIWRSRKGNKEPVLDKELHETCRLYDVVRLDAEETSKEAQVREDASLEDHMIMRSYLPLLRECIPDAAEELESDIYAYLSGRASKEEYVYDLYTVKDDMDVIDEEASHPFPLVQVDDDDEFYDGPSDSEYETDDSNAEHHPRNDYPDEISDEEIESEASDSDDESEEVESEDDSDKPVDSENEVSDSWGEPDLLYEDEVDQVDDDSDLYDDGDGDGKGNTNEEDGRWSYR